MLRTDRRTEREEGTALGNASVTATASIKATWQEVCQYIWRQLWALELYLSLAVDSLSGFTGDGKFTLRLWSVRSKFNKDEWAQQLPQLRKAAAMSSCKRGWKKLKVRHDNEHSSERLERCNLKQGEKHPRQNARKRTCCEECCRESFCCRAQRHCCDNVCQFRAQVWRRWCQARTHAKTSKNTRPEARKPSPEPPGTPQNRARSHL